MRLGHTLLALAYSTDQHFEETPISSHEQLDILCKIRSQEESQYQQRVWRWAGRALAVRVTADQS